MPLQNWEDKESRDWVIFPYGILSSQTLLLITAQAYIPKESYKEYA